MKDLERSSIPGAWLALCALLAATAASAGSLRATHNGDDDSSDEIPFDEAEVFVELNDTDGDLGIHALIDGEGWNKLAIETPNERTVLNVRVKGALGKQGLTEFFFESAEPTFDELTPAEFFARFPEGIYEIEGRSLDGLEMESEAEFSHVMPAPPDNVMVSGVAMSDDCDTDVPLVSEPIVISWDPVTTHHPGIGAAGEVEVELYEVVIEREEPTPLLVSIEVPPDVTEVEIPLVMSAPGQEYKYEILTRGDTHNNTAVESCFAL